MSETFVFIYADSFPNGRKERKKIRSCSPSLFGEKEEKEGWRRKKTSEISPTHDEKDLWREMREQQGGGLKEEIPSQIKRK